MKDKSNILSTISDLKKILILVSQKKRGLFFALLILTIISSVLPFVTLLTTQELLNNIQLQTEINYIIRLMVIYVSVTLINIMVSNLSAYLAGKYNHYLYYDLNVKVLKEIKTFNLRDFEVAQTYDLLQRAEQEVGVRPYQIIMTSLTILSSVISIIGTAIILINWHFWTIGAFIILPILSLHHFKKISLEQYSVVNNRTNLERKSWYVAQLLTKDTFVKEIKTLSLFDYLNVMFKKLRKQFMSENIRIEKRKILFTVGYQIGNFLISVLFVCVAIYEAINAIIPMGNLVTYINMTSKIENAIKTISNSIFSLHTNLQFSKNILRYFDYCNKKKYEKKDEDNKQSIESIEKIKFENVSYRYPHSDNYALKNINISISSGDCIALVGENGSGKSTLIKLLVGLYDDYSGDIYINEINIKNIKKESLFKNISSIFQDYVSYQFTVKENIGFGNIGDIENDDKVLEAARLSGAKGFIEKLPNQYNQQVGHWFQGGTQLSGGQWQKLAISRLFMKDVNLYILDEPTAALDPKSEFEFFKEFKSQINDKISIFSTHRFVNVNFTNKIIVLNNGIIIEHGDHNTLMNLKGKYYEMYSLQFNSILKEAIYE